MFWRNGLWGVKRGGGGGGEGVLEQKLEAPSRARRSSGAWRAASGLEMRPRVASADQSLASADPSCPKATSQGEDGIKNPELKGGK